MSAASAVSPALVNALDLPQGKERSMQVLAIAMQIADHTARADVECYAHSYEHPDGYTVYDLTKPLHRTGCTVEEQAEAVAIAERAARYIALRPAAFPYRMVRQLDNSKLVHFVDPEAG